MNTASMLREFHARTHRSLQQLMIHCRELDDGDLNCELEDFAYPTVRLQLHHEIGAEKYWIGVLNGVVEADFDTDATPDIASLETYRVEVAAAMEAYLRNVDPEILDQPRTMATWGGRDQELVPTWVVMRVLTHYFNHQGQIQAMLRRLGKPAPAGLDFPLEPVS